MQTYIKNRSGYQKGGYREVFDVETGETKLEVFIKSKLKVYRVVTVDRPWIEREEFCASKLEFTVMKDDTVSFNQGDAVSVKYDGEDMFLGYVFYKKRDKDKLIKVVCYDQLRYMKNRRTYTRGKMRLDEVVNKIADDYALRKGEIEKCSVTVGAVAAENVSLIDVVKKACSDVRSKSGERYILFDKCGELCLKNENSMVLDVVLDDTQAENYEYTDTIDNEVYNIVEVYSDKKKYNTRYLGVASDKETMDMWGTLILSKKATDAGNEKSEAEKLLSEYNRINREIVIKNVDGNPGFFPGSRVYVVFTMGDVELDGYMRIKKAVHVFENNVYRCDVYLDGSELG